MPNSNCGIAVSTDADVVSLRWRKERDTRLARRTKKVLEKEMAEEVAAHLRIKEAMRAFRTGNGYTQAQMANFLGTTEDNYQKYESYNRGDFRHVPTIIQGKFCRFADINLLDLIFPVKKARATNG